MSHFSNTELKYRASAATNVASNTLTGCEDVSLFILAGKYVGRQVKSTLLSLTMFLASSSARAEQIVVPIHKSCTPKIKVSSPSDSEEDLHSSSIVDDAVHLKPDYELDGIREVISYLGFRVLEIKIENPFLEAITVSIYKSTKPESFDGAATWTHAQIVRGINRGSGLAAEQVQRHLHTEVEDYAHFVKDFETWGHAGRQTFSHLSSFVAAIANGVPVLFEDDDDSSQFNSSTLEIAFSNIYVQDEEDILPSSIHHVVSVDKSVHMAPVVEEELWYYANNIPIARHPRFISQAIVVDKDVQQSCTVENTDECPVAAVFVSELAPVSPSKVLDDYFDTEIVRDKQPVEDQAILVDKDVQLKCTVENSDGCLMAVLAAEPVSLSSGLDGYFNSDVERNFEQFLEDIKNDVSEQLEDPFHFCAVTYIAYKRFPNNTEKALSLNNFPSFHVWDRYHENDKWESDVERGGTETLTSRKGSSSEPSSVPLVLRSNTDTYAFTIPDDDSDLYEWSSTSPSGFFDQYFTYEASREFEDDMKELLADLSKEEDKSFLFYP